MPQTGATKRCLHHIYNTAHFMLYMYQIKINTVAPLFVYYIHIKDVCYRQGPVSGGESAIHNSISSSLYLDVSIWRWQEAPAAPDSHIIWILTVTYTTQQDIAALVGIHAIDTLPKGGDRWKENGTQRTNRI
jgi:hypothetical protein